MLPLGIHLPVCRPDGSFEITQCNDDNCWCVNENGDKLLHSSSKFGLPDCARRKFNSVFDFSRVLNYSIFYLFILVNSILFN